MLKNTDLKELNKKISYTIETAQKNVVKVINKELINRNWEIGRHIVEYEQKGESRAKYGAKTLKKLSLELTKKYGRGFDIINLRLFRQFFIVFAKGYTVCNELN